MWRDSPNLLPFSIWGPCYLQASAHINPCSCYAMSGLTSIPKSLLSGPSGAHSQRRGERIPDGALYIISITWLLVSVFRDLFLTSSHLAFCIPVDACDYQH